MIAPLLSSVIAGLDPAIHPLRKDSMRTGWTAGSSPAVTIMGGETSIKSIGKSTSGGSIAARVTERYLDFTPVHRALAEIFNTPLDAN